MPLVSDLIKLLNPTHFFGNENESFLTIIPFDIKNTCAQNLMWVTASKNNLLAQLNAGTVLCEASNELPQNKKINLIVVPNAREAFRKVLENFFKKEIVPSIHATAIIHEKVSVPNDCNIGAYVVIEAGCIIGNGVQIGHHTVIGNGTIIEAKANIGTHCSIGGDGFGYEKNEEGHFILIPHIGFVHIKNNVDIGNHVCIDRGTLGATEIGAFSRIDNLVHIAHNVKIGNDTLVIAQAMIAGSCQIGNNVWIAPCAAILNKINVADDSKIGMGAMVFKNVNKGETVIGNPARVTKSE